MLDNLSDNGKLQRRTHGVLLPALAAAASATSGNCLRVRAHAVTAMINFCRPGVCATEAVVPHLVPVMQAIGQLLLVP